MFVENKCYLDSVFSEGVFKGYATVSFTLPNEIVTLGRSVGDGRLEVYSNIENALNR